MSTDQKSIDWYNTNAAGYAAHVRSPDESVYHSLYEKPAMYARLPDLKDKKVLSLGCGSGEDSKYLKRQGASESVGIDISQKMIEIASQDPRDCTFQVMNMEHLTFSEESFDFAYSSLAIHYIEDWTQVFQEVYRVLRPGSSFLFSCNHPVYFSLEITEESEEMYVRQLAKIKNKRTREVIILGNYMARKSLGGQDKLDVTTWSKPISEVVGEAKTAGFLISDIVEPKPDEKMKEVSPKDYATLTKIPNFIIFKLYKPQVA